MKTLLTIWNEDDNQVLLNGNFDSESDARKAVKEQLQEASPNVLLRCKLTNPMGLDQDVLIKDSQVLGAYGTL